MNLSERTHYRYDDHYGKLFDVYLEEFNPKSKQKADFGRKMGFDNYSHMKKELGYWSEENLPKIEQAILKLNNEALTKAFKVQKFSLNENKTLDDCLSFLNTIGHLTESDLNEYRKYSLNTDNPISLKQVITEELASSEISNIGLTASEKLYFINHHWETIPDSSKIKIVDESNIGHLDEFALKIVTRDFLVMYNKKENLDTTWRDEFTNSIEKPLLLCHKILFSKKYITCEILFDSIKTIFTKCYPGTDYEVYIKYANKIDAINKDDQNVISFFNQNCLKHSIESRSKVRNHSFLYGYDSEPKKVSISSVLRSNSLLAPPVLASYVLHSLGDASFDIERLYSCLYVIQKEPALKELCETFEPIERLSDTLRYSTEDLKNELVAVYILAERVQNLKSQESIQSYVENLHELNTAGMYHLVLSQACVFIQMGALLIEHNVFSRPFKEALNNASRIDIESLDQIEIEAACYFAKKEGISSGLLAIYTSEDMIKNCEFLSEDWIRPLIRSKKADSSILQKFFSNTDRDRINHYGEIHDYNKNLFWMLNVSCSEISSEEIKFDLHKKTALSFHTNEFSRRDRDYSANPNKLTIKQKRLLGIIRGRDVDEDHLWINADQFLVMDFLAKHRISNKRDILAHPHRQMISVIHDKCLHVFYHIDTNQLAEYILKFDIEEIVYYHTVRISGKYKDGHYGYRGEPLIGREARVIKTTITNVSSDVMNDVNKLSDLIDALKIGRFNESNPVSKLAERLAPKFYFMNKEFNENGKSYC